MVVNGVFSWGLPMFVVMTFFLNRDKLSPMSIGVSAVIYTLGGAAFGIAMWFVHERLFRKAGGIADSHLVQGGRLRHRLTLALAGGGQG